MFNPEAAGLSSELGELERLQNFIRLILDAKACGKRCEELTALTVQAIEAKAAAAQAETSLAAAKAEQDAAIDKRWLEVRQYHETVLAKDRDADQKLSRAKEVSAQVWQLDENMRRAVMRYSGWLHNDALQSLPTWDDLDRSVLGVRDAHYDDDSAMAVADETENVPSPNRIPGSTLTHERPLRTMRAPLQSA
ncbi:hypothetical protein BRAS3843_1730019 [Bradyrhizobium sp. STM 3843]|uniref:hypothetical protein n=1 Tax=Bradyrhizobium sp. STM 3843 TaxID=551947 RepID=UPI0002407124|nr:hypothetical protein [Bradyrhizobium sp. STM 3843]CCE06450.1 hypothetical protein BRAS3843_1730019 [Bradyrhizobium sp. STM 3843]